MCIKGRRDRGVFLPYEEIILIKSLFTYSPHYSHHKKTPGDNQHSPGAGSRSGRLIVLKNETNCTKNAARNNLETVKSRMVRVPKTFATGPHSDADIC
jgi:hypothetical protein